MKRISIAFVLVALFFMFAIEERVILGFVNVSCAERSSTNTELCEACFTGDIERVRHLIASVTNLKKCVAGVEAFTSREFGEFNRIDLSTCGPIRCCIMGESATWHTHTKTLAIIQTLIKAGADVDEKSFFRNTTLMEAARLGQSDIVQILLEAGADVHPRSRESLDEPVRRNALHFAVISNGDQRKEIIFALLEAGINPMDKDSSGKTPAMLARYLRRAELADYIGDVVSGKAEKDSVEEKLLRH